MRNASRKMESTLPNNISWKQINWIHINRYVEELQQRIYRAESLGMKRKVRELQRLLMHSKSALLLSIRRITQVNKGKKRMMQTPIIRHTMIKHNASPYDATLEEYFKMRDKKYNGKTRSQDDLG